MKDLIDLESDLKDLKRIKKEIEIKSIKKTNHCELVKDNKYIFKLMDIMVIIIILMNFGALTLTNMMVSKQDYKEAEEQNKTCIFFEENKVQAKLNNFQTIEDLNISEGEKEIINAEIKESLITGLRQCFWWAILLACYIYYRNTIYSNKGLYVMLLIINIEFWILGYDFFHDFGLYVGMLLYG